MKTTKLPKDFKAKWVAALRSGEYKQGLRLLYNQNHDSYCCIGVAAVICGVEKERLKSRVWLHHVPKDGILSNVPAVLRPDPITTDCLAELLAQMNDGREGERKTFCEIADYIEANL